MNATTEFEVFSKGALLDVLLPNTDKFDAVDLLRNGNPEEVRRAPARKHLFFDEKTSFKIVLRSSATEDAVRALLPSLELTISAHATNAVPEGPGNSAAASGKHDIASTKTPATDDVDVVTANEFTYVVWKPTLHLVRPRVRLQRPAVYFTANLSLIAGSYASVSAPAKTFLPSFEALPANVLEPLHHDLALGASRREIHVSENRVTKVSPSASQAQDAPRPLRGATKRAFPVVPAFFMRMGYSAVPDAVIASLHVEISPLITGDLKLDDVRIEMPGTVVESLDEALWPQRAQAGDEVVLLYRIKKQVSTANTPAKDADLALVSIEATASLDQDSTVEVQTQWQAQIDLSHSVKFAPYKWSRPLSTAFAGHRKIPSQSSSRPSVHEITQGQEKGGEVVFTFTAPPTTTKDSTVEIQVQCVNKSNRSRRFALVTAARRASVSATAAKPRFEKRASSHDTAVTAAALHDARGHEDAVQDRVLILTPDVRIGPLTAGACFETSLRYRATSTGILSFGTIRVVDLESRQTLDVAELPDVVSLEQQG